METMTSTTTGAQLEELDPHSSHFLTYRRDPTTLSDGNISDPILEASRLADSSVPDGGYGWVVIIAAAVVTWWFGGTSYSWGVIQGALVADGVGSPATLAFVGSLAISLISAMAIVNGWLVRQVGTQRTALLGITCLGLGQILGSFAVRNITGLFLTSGVVFGIGLSLCFMVGSGLALVALLGSL
jgi:hypothetical protein